MEGTLKIPAPKTVPTMSEIMSKVDNECCGFFVESSAVGELTTFVKACDGATGLLQSKSGHIQVIPDTEVQRMLGVSKDIVDAVEESLDKIDVDPLRREGQQAGRWVLLDYNDIVVHVQHVEERAYYDLERLWKDCPEIPLPPAPEEASE